MDAITTKHTHQNKSLSRYVDPKTSSGIWTSASNYWQLLDHHVDGAIHMLGNDKGHYVLHSKRLRCKTKYSVDLTIDFRYVATEVYIARVGCYV